MAINGARNAALFAAHIIGAYDSVTQARLLAFRERTAAEVLTKAVKLESLGAAAYLDKP
jgi:phosphoribosylcarboxyaminoimidazole (NCAIR) mutase